MKERMIIDIQKICKDCRFNTSSLCDKNRQDVISCEEGKEEASVIEQVPETWEDLKELCKVLDGCKIEEEYIEIIGCLVGSNILFCKDGAIMLNTDCCFVEKTSYDRMWQIIKNLIG